MEVATAKERATVDRAIHLPPTILDVLYYVCKQKVDAGIRINLTIGIEDAKRVGAQLSTWLAAEDVAKPVTEFMTTKELVAVEFVPTLLGAIRNEPEPADWVELLAAVEEAQHAIQSVGERVRAFVPPA